MKKYKCIISIIGENQTTETVIIEAKNKGEALVINCQLYPNTYVKEIEEILD